MIPYMDRYSSTIFQGIDLIRGDDGMTSMNSHTKFSKKTFQVDWLVESLPSDGILMFRIEPLLFRIWFV